MKGSKKKNGKKGRLDVPFFGSDRGNQIKERGGVIEGNRSSLLKTGGETKGEVQGDWKGKGVLAPSVLGTTEKGLETKELRTPNLEKQKGGT